MSNSESKLPTLIKDIIIIVIGVAIIFFVIQYVFGNPFYIVSSGSMIPVLNIGDILIVGEKDTFDELELGDVIVFNRPAGHDKVIVHRVFKILNETERIIVTKGDANDGLIPGTDFPIKHDDFIGQVVYVIPQVGQVLKALSPPVNYILIALIIGAMIFVNVRKGKKSQIQ
ncbi:MAG: signal peptidase I [Nitrososphaeraceae archaeon]|nr:signal peptidase I [Nitrososphaeraceae archaeon]